MSGPASALNKKSHIVFNDGSNPTYSSSIRFDDCDVEEPVQEEEQPCVPGPVTVIILSGGFSRDLVDEIERADARETQDPQYQRGGGKLLMIRGIKSEPRIPPALVNINGKTVLQYWLTMLQKSSKLMPLKANVHVVCNELDKAEFLKELRTVGEDQGYSYLGESNVLSNGASSHREWLGDVHDLNLALDIIQPSSFTLVVSATSVFWPEQDFAKCLEHSLIMGKDTIGFTASTNTSQRLNAGKVLPRVLLGGDRCLPPVLDIECAADHTEGYLEAVPICLLRKATLPVLKRSKVKNIVDLMGELVKQGTPIHAIDLEWGHMHTDSVAWIEYADEFFKYYVQQKCLMKKADKNRLCDEDFLFGDDVDELGESMRVNRSKMVATINSTLNKNPSEDFDHVYFARKSKTFKGRPCPYYSTPETFYLTEYRRFATGVGK